MTSCNLRKKSHISKTPSKSLTIEEIERIVYAANEVPCSDLLKSNSNSTVLIDSCCLVFAVKCLHSHDLSSDEKSKVFSLLENNMKHLYLKSSWGWNGESKLTELFSPQSRFLLCYPTQLKQTCAIGRHESPLSLNPSDKDPCAFVHFRFEVDARRPVLYCYEIQVLDRIRGMGLGQNLLQIMYKIAEVNKLTRIILTVFKFNSSAYVFFGRNGFKIDSTDLSKEGKFVDYSIMSRRP
nr:n alpha acetyltransferase 40 NatD catalytic [Hymenolepis microstoma]